MNEKAAWCAAVAVQSVWTRKTPNRPRNLAGLVVVKRCAWKGFIVIGLDPERPAQGGCGRLQNLVKAEQDQGTEDIIDGLGKTRQQAFDRSVGAGENKAKAHGACLAADPS